MVVMVKVVGIVVNSGGCDVIDGGGSVKGSNGTAVMVV